MSTPVAATSDNRRRFRAIRDVGSGMAAVGVKELRGRMRGKRAFVILTLYLLLVAGFAWMIESLAERSYSGGFSSAFSASSEIGRQMFMAIVFLLTLVTLILAPASTAGAISMEREKQTMDLLAVTPISSLAIVLGKLLSALSWILLLLLASIPVVALVFTFGGVSPDDVVRAYVVLLATAFAFGAIGVFVSALVRRTQAATVINLVAVIFLTAGTAFIFIFWTAMAGNSGFLPDQPVRRREPGPVADAPTPGGADVVQPLRGPAGRHVRHRDRLRRDVPGHRRGHEPERGLPGRRPGRVRRQARQLLATQRRRDGHRRRSSSSSCPSSSCRRPAAGASACRGHAAGPPGVKRDAEDPHGHRSEARPSRAAPAPGYIPGRPGVARRRARPGARPRSGRVSPPIAAGSGCGASVRRAWYVAAAVAVAELVLAIAQRLLPLEQAPLVALAIPMVGLLVLLVLVVRARPTLGETALAVDAEGGAGDAVASALAFASAMPATAGPAEGTDDDTIAVDGTFDITEAEARFVRRQRRDAAGPPASAWIRACSARGSRGGRPWPRSSRPRWCCPRSSCRTRWTW